MIRRRTSGARACSSALLLLGALGCGDSGTSKPDSDAALDVNPMGGMDMGSMAGMDMGGMDMGAMGGMDMGSMAGMDMGPMISCEGDSRVSMYMDGLTRAGLAGAVQVKITSASPSPPANGYNTWTVQILDRLGNPMAGTLSVIPDMPDHGHVSPQTPVITPGASIGAYTVSNLYLFMAGVWRIQISISSGTAADGGALLDIVTFFFCVQG
jgi:hypothetical protein